MIFITAENENVDVFLASFMAGNYVYVISLHFLRIYGNVVFCWDEHSSGS